MGELSTLFSKLDERYGLPTAGLAFASFVAFLLALKDGFHLTNRTLMVAGTLFSVSCAFYVWHGRDQSSVSYVGEKESFARWLRDRIWSFFTVFVCMAAASVFAYAAWTRGQLPIK